MFFVYILSCKDGSYYTGNTEDIDKRLAEHKFGLCKYTSIRRPIKLVFLESFQTRDEALNAERQIKGWNRKKKQLLIKNKIKDFSKKVAL